MKNNPKKLIFCSLFIAGMGIASAAFGENATEPTANISVKITFSTDPDTQDVIKEIQQAKKDFIVEFINKNDISEAPGDLGVKVPYTALSNNAGNYGIIINFNKIPYAKKNTIRYLGWVCKKTIKQKINSKIITQKLTTPTTTVPLEWNINLITCKSGGII